MDIKRLNFKEYVRRVGHDWSLLVMIGFFALPIGTIVYFGAIAIAPIFLIFFAFSFIISFLGVQSEYKEYLKFMDIVESDDCGLYIQKIKASGQVAGYDIGTDCSLAIKNGTIYWFNYSLLKSRGSRGSLYGLELNTNISWKITSRGNIQIKASYYSGLGTFNTFNIFNHIDEIRAYLPENLKKEA